MRYWENCLKQIETKEQKTIDELVDRFNRKDPTLEIKVGDKIISDIIHWCYTSCYEIELEKGARIPVRDFVYLNGIKCFKIKSSTVDSHGYQIFYIEELGKKSSSLVRVYDL